MKLELEDYIYYIQIERGFADNILQSYRRDVLKYIDYISEVEKIKDWDQVDRSTITRFLYNLNDNGATRSTISRTLSTLRKYHQFVVMDKILTVDPTLHIKAPTKKR